MLGARVAMLHQKKGKFDAEITDSACVTALPSV